MKPDSEHVADRADDYIHDLLPPEESDRFERHCATCPECRKALDRARRRAGALQAVPPTEASRELVTATVEVIDEHQRQAGRRRGRVLWGGLGTLAACVLALVGLHLYFATLKPGSLDLVVLGQNQLMASTMASLRVRLVDRGADRAAVAGVPVVVEMVGQDGQRRQLASFQTDAAGGGNPRFQVPDWADGSYQLVVTAGKESVTKPVTLTRSWKLMLSSDKPVYKPGQTIQLRA